MILLLLMAFEPLKVPECTIDRCEGDICVVETPDGWVNIPRNPDHHEGKEIVCPRPLVKPT